MERIKAEHLNINDPFIHNITEQKYYNFSMITPNQFPLNKRYMGNKSDVYLFKLHGVYENDIDRKTHAEKLQKKHKHFDIYPATIGALTDFDVDIMDCKDAQIIYREEKLNEFNDMLSKKDIDNEENELVKEVSESKEMENTEDKREIKMDSQSLTIFHKNVKHQKFGCVSFYTREAFKELNDVSTKKKIPAVMVHCVFETPEEAQKFCMNNQQKYPAIFIMDVGYWCSFYVDLKQNFNLMQETHNELVMKGNNYMKKYLDSLEQDAIEESQRKKELLKDANIVTGKYDELRKFENELNPPKMDNSVVEEKTSEKLTEEETVDKELLEIQMQKIRLQEKIRKENENASNTLSTEKEFNEKLNEINNLYKKLNE